MIQGRGCCGACVRSRPGLCRILPIANGSMVSFAYDIEVAPRVALPLSEPVKEMVS
jgi:hypothetical protein